ncbi:hypothetical protein A2U01_0084700, partial [Trifolium medium]|nr:hypothetical protein [Trifolium medium]
MKESKPISTPMVSSLSIDKDESGSEVE